MGVYVFVLMRLGLDLYRVRVYTVSGVKISENVERLRCEIKKKKKINILFIIMFDHR